MAKQAQLKFSTEKQKKGDIMVLYMMYMEIIIQDHMIMFIEIKTIKIVIAMMTDISTNI